MAEYKNVENIMQLFDEEFKKTRQLIQKGETHLDNLAEGFLEADRVIRKIPTADVVPVVRCKDCVYCVDLGTSGLYCDHDDNRNPLGCRPNDYCNDGERRGSNE